MSIHIGAKKGEIAEIVLMPGDPLRAKHIAENYLTDITCYNEVRNMLGFTGYYNGKRVSVQGSGMGIPSIGIYATELIREYDVKRLIRVGTAGALQPHIHVRDIVVAMSASTTSNINNRFFNGTDYSPTANFDLFMQCIEVAKQKNIPIKAGNVLSSDIFYEPDPDWYKIWSEHGVLCVEMETSILYTLAAKYNVQALGIFTISDSLLSKEFISAEERQNSVHQMTDLALGLV
jgi:purine-nucleoside phosphorylase